MPRPERIRDATRLMYGAFGLMIIFAVVAVMMGLKGFPPTRLIIFVILTQGISLGLFLAGRKDLRYHSYKQRIWLAERANRNPEQ